MNKLKLILLTLLAGATSVVSAQNCDKSKVVKQDSLLYSTSVYFHHNNSLWIDVADFDQMCKLYYTYKGNPDSKVKIEAWADSTGTSIDNKQLSQRRAETVSKYLIKEGVNPKDIALINGNGVDLNASTDSLARRAEISVVFVTEKCVAKKECKQVVKEDKIVEKPKANSAKVAGANKPKKKNVANKPKKAVVANQPQPSQKPLEDMTVSEKVADIPEQSSCSYYVGVGVGPSFGSSTLVSFAESGVKLGVNASVFGGVEFNKFISAELSVGYTHLALGMNGCCSGLYYVNGNRFYAPIAGKTSYRYEDLVSRTNLWSISARANFNMLGKASEKWQLLLIPNVGVGFSSAKLKYSGNVIDKQTNTHLIAGGALGAAYFINDSWGVRLTSGVDYLWGGAFDAMPQCEHENGYIWNTTASVIYKF